MPKQAGTYTLVFKVEGTTNYTGLTETITITVKKIVVTVPDNSSVVYDGEKHSSAYSDGQDGNLWTAVNVTDKVGVGNYTVSLTLKDPGNYEWATNKSSAKVDVTYSITQATNSWTTAPALSKLTWKYDEDVASFNNFGAKFGDIMITLNGEEITEIPDRLDVGTYTVVFLVEGNNNYTGLTKSVIFTIEKAHVAIPDVALSVPYTGDEQTSVIATTFRMRSVPLYRILTPANGTVAGQYDIVLELLDPNNYTWVRFTEGSDEPEIVNEVTAPSKFEIIQAVNVWREGCAPLVNSITYGQSVLASAMAEFGEVRIEYSLKGYDAYSTSAPTDAGEYTARFTVVENENYSGLEATVDFTIEKKQVAVPSDISVVYNRNSQASTFAGEFTSHNISRINVGAYDVTLDLLNANNYVWIKDGEKLDSSSVTVKFNITKATVFIADLGINGWTYGSAASEPTYTISNEYDGQITYLYTGTTNGGIAYSSANAPTEAGSYTLTLTIAATDNCDIEEGKGSVSKSFTIARKVVTAPSATLQTIPYDGAKHAPDLSGLDSNCRYDGNVGITNVGEYSIEYYLPDVNNYEWTTGRTDNITVDYYVIEQATNVWNPTPTISKNEWTYGQASATLNSYKSSFGEVTVTLNGNTYTGMPTDAGEYTLKFTVAGNENYTGLEATITFTINKVVINVSTLDTNVSKTYNNELFKIGTKGTGYTVAFAEGKNAGTYTGKYTLDKNYIWSTGNEDDIVITLVINPIIVTVPSIGAKQYTGSLLKADIIKDDAIYTVITNNGGIDVGLYDVQIELIDKINYIWSGGDTDSDGIAELEFEITKVIVNGWETAPSFSKTEWTYGEAAGVPSATAKFGAVKVQYKLKNASDSTYTDVMPTNAGEYTAKFLVDGTDDYAAIASTYVDFTINKKEITIVVNNTTYTYDGNAHNINISVKGLVGEDTVTINGNTSYTDAGSYNVTLTVNDANYYCEAVESTLVINKANYTPTLPGTLNATYGDTLANVVLPTDANGSWSWNDATTTSVGVVGTRTFKATFTHSNENYNTYEADITVVVVKKTLTISIVDNTFDYNGSAHSIQYNVSGVLNGDQYTVNGNISRVEAGTYDVTLTIDEDNYTATLNTQLVINPIDYPNKYTPTVNATIYGNMLSDIILPTDENGVWTWNDPTASVGTIGTRSFAATFTPNSGNYKSYTVNVSVTVNKKAITIVVVDDTFTYDGASHSVQVRVDGLVGSDTVTVNGNTTQTNAGRYDVTLSVTNPNYSCNAVNATLVIEKADYIPTMPVTLNATYGDTLANVTFPHDTNGTWSWNDEITTSVGVAGTKTFKATFIHQSGNYKDYECDITVNVAKQKVSVPATNTSAVYTGSQLLTSYTNGALYTVTNASGTNVGNYDINFTLTDSDNYVWANGDEITTKVTFSITKATVSISNLAINGWTYGGTASTPTFNKGAYDGTVTYLYTGTTNGGASYSSTVAPTQAGNYTFTVTITATDNCDIAEGQGSASATFTIARKTVTAPSATLKTYTYDGTNHIPDLSGLDANCMYDSNNGITNAGTYTIVYYLPDVNNYEWSTGGTANISVDYIKIVKATNSWTTTPSISKTQWGYGEDPATINDYKSKFGNVTVTLNGNPYTAMPTNAGTYTLKFVVADCDNYSGLEVTITFEIKKIVVTIPTTNFEKTYTGSELSAGATGGLGYTVIDGKGTNVGTYTLTYQLVDENYVWGDGTVTDKTVNFVINPKPIDVPSNTYSKVYDGTTLTSGATAGEGYIIVTDAGGINAGQYNIVYGLANSNYIWSDGTTANKTVEDCFEITKKIVEAPEIWQTLPYNGLNQSVTVTDTYFEVLSYVDNNRTNVGEYVVNLQLKDANNCEWKDGKSTTKLVISMTTPVISGTSITGWDYKTYSSGTNAPFATITNISGLSPSFKYLDKDGNEVVDLLNLVPGTYTLVAYVEGTSNYEAAESSVQFQVNKLSLNVPNVTGTYTYTGVSIMPIIAESDKYTITMGEYINAGTYYVTLTLTDDQYPYYKWSTDTTGEAQSVQVPFTIGKAQATISSLTLSGWEYNADNIPSYSIVEEKFDSSVTYLYTGTTNAGVAYSSANVPTEAGNYRLTATIADTDNCYGTFKYVDFTISPKSVTIPTTLVEKVYTGATLTSGITNGAGYIVKEDNGGKNVGTYKVIYAIVSSNYIWSDGTTTNKVIDGLKINPATTTLTVSLNKDSVVYNGSPFDGLIINTNLTGEDPIIRYTGTTKSNASYDSSVAPTNAGSYTVTVTYLGDSNHTGAEGSATFTITQATPNVIFNSYNVPMYQNNVVASGTALGVGNVSLPGIFEVTTAPQFVAGDSRNDQTVEYKVKFTPDDSCNYISVSYDLSVTLKPAAYAGDSSSSATWYGSIEDALNNTSTGKVWAVLDANDDASNGNTIVKTTTVKSGVTFIIPYEENVETTSRTAILHGAFSHAQPIVAIANTVTIADGKTLEVEGTLKICGEIWAGHGGSTYTGHTNGKAAQIVLGKNAKIETTNNSGLIDLYGFIEETYQNNYSSVVINTGGSIYVPFVIKDFKGGSMTSGINSGGNTAEGKVAASVFNQIAFINIMPTLEIQYGGALHIMANMFSNDDFQSDDAMFIGGDSGTPVIKLNEGAYLRAKYDKNTFIIKLDIYGGATTNALNLTVAGVRVSTSNFAFAVSYQYDISLKVKPGETSASYTMGQIFKLLPGAKITVDKGATLHVEDMNLYPASFIDVCTVAPYPTKNPATGEAFEDAKIIVYGKLTANKLGGKVYIMDGADFDDSKAYSTSTQDIKSTGSLGYNPQFTTMQQDAIISRSGIVITLNTNGADIIGDVISIPNNDNQYLYPKLPIPLRDGYRFDGWYYNGVKVNAGEVLNVSESHQLVAQWIEITEITFATTGGTVHDRVYATSDGKYPTLPTPIRNGYVFDGWYCNGVKVVAGDAIIDSESHTLYAKWRRLVWVSYVSDELLGEDSSMQFVDNENGVYPAFPTVTGGTSLKAYTFKNWHLDSTSGTVVSSLANLKPTSDVVLYAEWDTGGSCVTPDTLITLADGTQVRVDSLTGNEMLLVWNMQTGKLDFAPIMFIDSDPEAVVEVIYLYFSDGTVVKVISEHGFWDYDINKYVYLDRDAQQYIGHSFAKQNGDVLEKVQLVDVVIEQQLTTAWSPVTEGHLCYFVNGMLSMPGGIGGLFNIFDVNPDTMTYDEEAMMRDIETYGLFTYEELNAIVPLSKEMFNLAGGAYMKISIGKGNLTMEELVTMIERYSKYFE